MMPSMKINAAYKPYIETDKRINVFYGGAGSGKSKFVVQKMIIKLLQDKRKCLVIRKVQATIKDSVFMEFITLLGELNILNKCYVNKSDLNITLPNGSSLIFKGLDDKEKIKSISGIDDIVIEEATELTLDDFTQLNLRLRSDKDNLQMHLMFNPVSKANWVYNTFFESNEFGALIVKTTYKDNHFLPEDYINSIKKLEKTNPAYFKIYVLGEFATLDKLVYPCVKVEEFDYKELIRQGKKAYFGLDFGYTNDETAFVGVIHDEVEKKIYIFDEIYKSGMLNDEIAKAISYLGYGKEIITADCSEPKSIAELKRLGLYRIVGAKKGKDSVMNGIQFINQHEIIVNPKCENMIMEFENYTWKKDKMTNEYINEPVDKFNHLCDALRYALEKLNRGKGVNVLK